MKDPVVLDEINHDLQDQKAVEGYDECLKRAWEEYNCGELEDELRDMVADYPGDASMIAACITDAIRRDVDSISEALSGCKCYLKDFMASEEGIVEGRALRLYEDGE